MVFSLKDSLLGRAYNFNIFLPAQLLVDCLLKLVVVDNSSELAIAVAGPVGCHQLNCGLTNINPKPMMVRIVSFISLTYFSLFDSMGPG